MSTGDKIALISLVFTVVTTIGVIFLAYAALAQAARPNITARLLSTDRLQCDMESTHVFELINLGHWYGSPMAVDVTVYCDFPREFELRELRYGSIQEHANTEIKAGAGGTLYLKAKGLKLSRHDTGEEVHVIAKAPATPGDYRIRVTAYSSNDAHFSKEFVLTCRYAALEGADEPATSLSDPLP